MKTFKIHRFTAAVAVIAVLAVMVLAAGLACDGGGKQLPNSVTSYDYLTGDRAFSDSYQTFKQGSTTSNTEITVYNDNLALVKERRTIHLQLSGINPVQYTDVASQIQPDTVLFRDLTDSNAFVVEQNYQYDLVSQQALLQRYLGSTITVTDTSGVSYTGTLLSYSGAYILQTATGVVAINEVSKIEYPSTEGLLVQPTLLWQVYTESPGYHNIETSYLTGGMDWEASYVLEVNDAETLANIQGWVTVNNNAGTSFEDASLKLVAGEVHRVYDGRDENGLYGAYPDAYAQAGYSPEQFAEEAFFEYHIYTLGRTTDILNNEMKQISLFTAENVPVVKEFVYEPQQYYYYSSIGYNTVQVMLNIDNSEETGLGIPIPAGTARIYQMDSYGSLQFAGEDSVDHTPVDEHLRLYVGNAFDVIGERSEVEYDWLNENTVRFTVEYTISNHKEEAVSVTCLEHLYGDWDIIYASMPYTEKDSSTLEFVLNVPADGEVTATFTVQQTYY